MRTLTRVLGLLLLLTVAAWAPAGVGQHDSSAASSFVVAGPAGSRATPCADTMARYAALKPGFDLLVLTTAKSVDFGGLGTRGYSVGRVGNDTVCAGSGPWSPGDPPPITWHLYTWDYKQPGTYTIRAGDGCGGTYTTGPGTKTLDCGEKTPSPPTEKPETKKPGAAKTKSILNAKSKQTLATAAGRLRGYAENASALSKLCVLGALKKEALKQSLKAAAKDLAVSYVPLVGDIPTDPCSAVMTSFIAIISVEADWFDQLAKDPPDRNYRTLVAPKVRVPVSFSGTAQTVKVAGALNALMVNLARVHAYQQAVLTSVERAQGASAARNGVWTRKQTTAARRFAGLAATALSATPGLARQLASALQAAGYGTAAMTAADAAAFQSEVKAGGLPKDLNAALTVFGAPARVRAQLRAGLQSANPDELVTLGFPQILTDSSFGDAIRSGAAEMRRIARG